MHRSGTSALAGMLGLAGAALPAHLMPATEANARGFFESQRLFELHEELLAELHSSWDDISPLPVGFLRSRSAGRWVKRLADAVAEEFADAPLFVIKDPRICRIVPLWARVLERVDARPHYLIAMRNPLDVAASLGRQHKIQEAAALLLWLDHVLRAEHDTRGQPRVVLRYESLLEDWRRVVGRLERQLGITFPERSPGSETEIDQFLSSSMRSHAGAVLPAEREDLAGWVEQVYSWAVQADRDEDAPPEILDPIRRALLDAGRAFGPVLDLSRVANRELRSDAVDLRAALDEARQERNQRNEELREVRGELVVAREETTRQRTDLEAHEVRFETARQELNRRKQELALLRDEVTRQRTDLETRETQLKTTRQELNLRGEEVVRAHREIALLRDETTQQRGDLEAREVQFETARQELSRRNQEFARTQEEFALLRDEAIRQRGDLEAREIELKATRQELNLRGEEVARAHGEISLLRDHSARLQSDLADREEHMERLFDWVKVLLPWASEAASDRPVSPEVLGEILAALDSVAPAQRGAAATAGLRFAAQAARIEVLEENQRHQLAAEAELQQQLSELEKELAERADARVAEIRTLDLRAARLRAEFVVAVERSERRERELVELDARRERELVELAARRDLELAESTESHAAEVSLFTARAEASDAELAALVASAARIADERADVRSALARAQAEVADLELYKELLRARLATLEQSRIWRSSGPMRALAGMLRG